jgi:actin-related protein
VQTYELFDGNQVIIEKEMRYKFAERLFQPGLDELECAGLDSLVQKCVDTFKWQADDLPLFNHTNTYLEILPPEIIQHIQRFIPGSVNKNMFYKNIVLSGGPSLLPGLGERLKLELEKNVNLNNGTKSQPTAKLDWVDVKALPNRQYLDWIGGSIFGSLSTFANRCISVDAYNENGPAIVNFKCF